MSIVVSEFEAESQPLDIVIGIRIIFIQILLPVCQIQVSHMRLDMQMNQDFHLLVRLLNILLLGPVALCPLSRLNVARWLR